MLSGCPACLPLTRNRPRHIPPVAAHPSAIRQSGITTTCAAFSHNHEFLSDNNLTPKILRGGGAPSIVVDAVDGRSQMRQHEGLDPRFLGDTADILDRCVVGL